MIKRSEKIFASNIQLSSADVGSGVGRMKHAAREEPWEKSREIVERRSKEGRWRESESRA